jgi:hypothetical protein
VKYVLIILAFFGIVVSFLALQIYKFCGGRTLIDSEGLNYSAEARARMMIP